MTRTTKQVLNRLASVKGWSMAEVIRKAITAMLEKAEKKEEGR